MKRRELWGMTPREIARAHDEVAATIADDVFPRLSAEALALIAAGRVDLAHEARQELARPRRTNPTFPDFLPRQSRQTS